MEYKKHEHIDQKSLTCTFDIRGECLSNIPCDRGREDDRIIRATEMVKVDIRLTRIEMLIRQTYITAANEISKDGTRNKTKDPTINNQTELSPTPKHHNPLDLIKNHTPPY